MANPLANWTSRPVTKERSFYGIDTWLLMAAIWLLLRNKDLTLLRPMNAWLSRIPVKLFPSKDMPVASMGMRGGMSVWPRLEHWMTLELLPEMLQNSQTLPWTLKLAKLVRLCMENFTG
jgi:hypothetical protein